MRCASAPRLRSPPAATLSTMSVDVSDLAPAEASARLQEGGWQVVDVRTAEERPDGVIEGDVHIALDELSQRASEIDPARPALIYCRSGSRSSMAVAALRTAGYDAHNLAGGMLAWLEAGLPVVGD
jgi:rhodanese-related sulfurtransferase